VTESRALARLLEQVTRGRLLDFVATLEGWIGLALDTPSANIGSTPFEVVRMPFVPLLRRDRGFSPNRVLAHLEELAEIGVTVNPSFVSTATAPLFPPSKSPGTRRWPVDSS
jgi:hypothetical protein